MKKILHIKWERVLVILYGMFYVIKLTSHIINYGFDFESDMCMFLICLILLLGVYAITLDLRKRLLKEVCHESN